MAELTVKVAGSDDLEGQIILCTVRSCAVQHRNIGIRCHIYNTATMYRRAHLPDACDDVTASTFVIYIFSRCQVSSMIHCKKQNHTVKKLIYADNGNMFSYCMNTFSPSAILLNNEYSLKYVLKK